ncbi:reverse transcriptase domain-containing protein [Variovorax sp. YR216]|uniref:reverse transcriptase domain-containing protein n=1 Tax=Variovorax sp. YR216 TaxID=1882828 RepID=UPI00210A91B7|nr:reverse transcriptase domain-containing protein [Variovorax sp. YR216]
MAAKWEHRFERKPGRWVFVPSDEARAIGENIRALIAGLWQAPEYYFHLRAGGHVAALREHQASSFFFKVDISDFFGSVSRSRLSRVLKAYFSHQEALRFATESTVRDPANPGRTMIPYGFVQSPLLASLVLQTSRLGLLLDRLSKEEDLVVTVYVDDIVVSGHDKERLERILEDLRIVARRSRFELRDEKQQGPASSIEVFNIELSAGTELAVSAARLAEFSEALLTATSANQAAGISNYVRGINAAQAADL